jgi:sugar lactone lactonase YvrE
MQNRFSKLSGFLCAALAALALSTEMARAAVPAVVASSEARYSNGGMTDPTKVVIDGNGNIFTADSGAGALFGVAPGGGKPVSLLTGLGGTYGVAVDQYNDIIVSASYNGHIYFIPAASVATALTGGSIGTPVDLTGAYNFGQLDGYYSSFADVTVDKNNVVYISTNYCNCGSNAIFSVQTQGTSTTSSTINVSGVANLVLSGLPNSANSMAVDTSNHLFYADGANVYEVLLTATKKTPVVIGSGFSKPTGVSVDSSGNLFVSDNNTGLLWEIPNENGTLNPADQFALGTLPNLYVGVAFDLLGNIYSADGYAGNSIDKTSLGALNFGAFAVNASSGNINVNFTFNATTTPAKVGLYQGTSAASEFHEVYSTCFNNPSYTKGQSCLVNLNFTPASTGKRTGAVVLQAANNTALATAYLSGVGTGAALTLDPGTQSTLTALTSWKTPSAVALDGASNIYVTDSSASVVQVISAGGVATNTIGSGLLGPKGIVVDGAGNVIIADTGNNRVVAVPNENGTLNTADQIVLLSSSTSVGGTTLNSPLGVAVDIYGTIYVADSGNKRVLKLTTTKGLGLVSVGTIGSGYTTPAGVATDSSGNLFVTDSSAGQIDEINQSTGVQTIALGSLAAPTAISIDASGSAYVVESGASSVLRIPNVGGALNPNTQLALGSLSLLRTPSGVAVNGAGNVAIADSGVPGVFTLVRTTGSLQFGSVDTSQSSISQTLTLTNAGTSSLTLGATAYTATGATSSFAVSSTSGNGCTNGQTLALGVSCGYSAVFSPTATGPLTSTLTFSSNVVNAQPVKAVLAGTGTNLSVSTTTLSVSPASPYYGEVVNVIATVTGTNAAAPTGTVTFYVDGIAQVPSSLTTSAPYTATFTFAAGTLTASTHIMGASYSGDANNASSHAAPFTLIITREPSATVAAVYPTVAQPSGSAFIFTATVSNVALGTPSGTVGLVAAGTTSPILATGNLSQVKQANGSYLDQATVTYTPPTATGTYSYQLVYGGDVNFLPSTSNTTSVMVQPVGYTVTIPSSGYTVTDGGSIVIPITITGISGYGGNVTVGAVNTTTNVDTPACTGLPTYVTCTFTPGYVSLSGGNYPVSNPTGVFTLTLATSVPPPTTAGASMLWPGCLAGLLALAIAKRRSRVRSRMMTLMSCLLLAGMALGAGGCGSSGTGAFQTPKGTSNITLTFSGTPVGGYGLVQPPIIPNIVNTATISLTVQ